MGLVIAGVLRACFISRGGDLPLIPVLLGIVGGALAFGLLGLFMIERNYLGETWRMHTLPIKCEDCVQ